MSFRVLVVALCLVAVPLAGRAQAPEAPSSSQDEYDFSWLDPDKKIYVVQNRKYTKKNRLEVAATGGFGIGEPYRSRRTFMPRAFYYLNESWGVGLTAGFNSNSENENFVGLKSVSSVVPAVRDIQNFWLGSIVWVPFYGKINMFNQIFYLDWHLEVGVGQANTEIDLNTSNTGAPNINESSHTTFHWGTGQKFFITRHWAARLDFLAIYYKAPTGIDGSLTSVKGSTEDTYDNLFVTLGVSYTF